MTVLIILGNKNQHTFANSIVAANQVSLQNFKQTLSEIYVIHSKESNVDLKISLDWINHLESNGINHDVLIERVIEISNNEDSIQKLVKYVEKIVRSVDNHAELFVDLTNGTTLQKHILSVLSYILDIKNQYFIDIPALSKLTEDRGFIEPGILAQSYFSAPDSKYLDDLAYLNLTELVRYKQVIKQHTDKYIAIGQHDADDKFFQDNLSQSIQLKLQGDKSNNNAVHRIASTSISASIEELLTLLMKKFIQDKDRLTLGEKINIIQSRIREINPDGFDMDFFTKFNDFMLYLRNSTTHKGGLLTNIEKFKADLSVKMAFPFIEMYTDIIYPTLDKPNTFQSKVRIKKIDNDTTGQVFYYGLDGDNTGGILEKLFLSSTDEGRFTRLSRSVTKAINDISTYIKDRSSKNSIVFAAGDDLLFKGQFNHNDLEEMQTIYQTVTSGLTCSIGYGSSFQEVYIALKLAKTQPQKNAIFGIELQPIAPSNQGAGRVHQ